MIDFHSHILHNIDDGPTMLEGSLAMARIAVENGITTMLATPHAPGPANTTPTKVHNRLAELRAALHQADIPLEVLPGNELFYDPALPARLKRSEMLTCNNSKTILVECPINDDLPSGFAQLVQDVQAAGYRMVLAHPERILDVKRNPNVLIPFIEQGVLMQLTAPALVGEQGDQMQKLARTLATHRLVHLMASDAHGPSYRPPRMLRPYQAAVELVGADEARALVLHTPHALLNDLPVDLPSPREVTKKPR